MSDMPEVIYAVGAKSTIKINGGEVSITHGLYNDSDLNDNGTKYIRADIADARLQEAVNAMNDFWQTIIKFLRPKSSGTSED